MYLKALKEDINIIDLFKTMKYKAAFKKNNPNYFEPCGTCIFTGPQGSGKTLSAVNYTYKLLQKYKYAILCTNIALSDYPFNASIINGKLISKDEHVIIDHTEFVWRQEISHYLGRIATYFKKMLLLLYIIILIILIIIMNIY